MATTRAGLQAKYLSKSIREKAHLRESWNRQRRSVMYALLAVKFRDRYLRKRLLSTGESQLIEWVKSKEGFWGALTYDGRTSQNTLGQLLMQLREFIRTHQQAKNGSDVTQMRDCNQAPGEPVQTRLHQRKHHAPCNPIQTSRAVSPGEPVQTCLYQRKHHESCNPIQTSRAVSQ